MTRWVYTASHNNLYPHTIYINNKHVEFTTDKYNSIQYIDTTYTYPYQSDRCIHLSVYRVIIWQHHFFTNIKSTHFDSIHLFHMAISTNNMQKGDLPISSFIITDTTEPNTPTQHKDTEHAVHDQPTITTKVTRQLSYNPDEPDTQHNDHVTPSIKQVLKRGRSTQSLHDLLKKITNFTIFTNRFSTKIQPRVPHESIPIPHPTPYQRTLSSDGQSIDTSKQKWLHDEEYISDDELKLCDELRNKIGHKYVAHMNNKLLMIFLLSRHMNMDDTIVLIRRHIEWRNNEMNLPNAVQFDELNKSLVECGLTYWTHATVHGEARTIQYFEPSKLKFNNSFTIKELVQYLLWGYEFSARNFPLSRFRLGYIHVIDLSNIGRMNIPGTSQLRQLRSLMSDHFPMRLRYVYLIHCNWWTNILLRCAALVLKDRLMDRIHKLHIDELAHIIDVKYIPSHMQGEWKLNYKEWVYGQDKNDIIHKQDQ